PPGPSPPPPHNRGAARPTAGQPHNKIFIGLLAQQSDDGAEQMLAARYNTIARFLPGLLRTFTFE
ncbi:hypothetical protein ACFVGY_37620, partial [Streptomyces sp. NPDC127106]|uniref:hypothetical protein n=1 Tax=Streptomyces sp. NPDC127106 TaxID=3345360 RepID=UPI00363918B0